MEPKRVVAEAYPQVVALTQEELETFLAKKLVARLGTHNADGTIHLTPNWYIYQNGVFSLSSQTKTRKVKNIQRDHRVTLLIDTDEMPYTGVMIYGMAELDTEGAMQKRIPIFERYIGEHAEGYAQGLADKWRPVIIRVKPTRVISFDDNKGSLL